MLKTRTELHPNIAALQSALARAECQDIRDFVTHMLAIHPKDRLPSRSDFDPLRIPQLLPGIVLVRVEPPLKPGGSNRFRILVAGETVLRALEMPLIGRYVDEISAGSEGGHVIVDVRQKVVDTGQVYYWNGAPRMRFRLDFAGVEYCHCPLAADGKTVDHVLTYFHYKA
ncbi:hypothetical protein [uncultured Ferrovibrio sp.]|jgi:hypothetical protein|uniref:hypothetical protein n=1 Tax=uncultured Ferrovibrio sp. TaxID=1576913 RepID=UPI00261942A4|nr:hypothetical protein [uncultured Ferrovibrio sp.]